MGDAASNGVDRLDSWKAIAGYLGRDERTIRRWEKSLGLPIRRVADGRGHSVFAFKSEIDAWLLNRGRSAAAPAAIKPAVPPKQWRARAGVVAAAAVAVVSVCAWWVAGRGANAIPSRVDLTTSAIVAFDNSGDEQWQFRFPAGERVEIPDERRRHPVEILSEPPGILTATQLRVSATAEAVHGGELLALTSRGDLQRTFAFDDHLTFGAGAAYGAPWGITDFRVSDASGRRAVALAAHHYQWWPSIITVLDETFRRRGTFVNAGWLERVHWIGSDRLMVSGFSEGRDGGVVALLDANALDGQSPEEPQSRLYCQMCGTGRPLRYVVMPRSELNRITGSRFNRARLEVHETGVTVRTLEMKIDDANAVDALYEFTPSLDLVSASYSERYWEEHRALEIEGKLGHTRQECPDRDGPRELQVWDPQSDWRTVRIR